MNSDLTKFARVDTEAEDWQESPAKGVWRKRLDLAGAAESSRVTSVVRYDAGSAFPSHPHPNGEEIFVLDGVFSDDTGDYPAGSYLLNPEGFDHAPRSKDGCVLFVKLQQYPGDERDHVALRTEEMDWQPRQERPGTYVKPLYSSDDHSEVMSLVKFDAGCKIPYHDHPGGEEVFILEGGFEDENGSHGPGTWLRYPVGSEHSAYSPTGAIIYLKVNHLPG